MQILCKNALMQMISNRSSGPSLCQMKSRDKGAKITSFNMFRFLIHNIRGTDNCVQFSQLKFMNKNGVTFQFSSNDNDKVTLRKEVSQEKTDGTWGDKNNEDGVSGLMVVGQKCCIVDADIPKKEDSGIDYYITYTLLNSSLDISIYNSWSFYTANDASARDPWFFELQVRNKDDQTKWQTVDTHLSGSLLTSSRNTLAYVGNINIENLK